MGKPLVEEYVLVNEDPGASLSHSIIHGLYYGFLCVFTRLGNEDFKNRAETCTVLGRFWYGVNQAEGMGFTFHQLLRLATDRILSLGDVTYLPMVLREMNSGLDIVLLWSRRVYSCLEVGASRKALNTLVYGNMGLSQNLQLWLLLTTNYYYYYYYT